MPNDQVTKHNRRSFLFLIPLSIFGGVFTAIATAGFRFLRPRISQNGTENWTDVAPLSELQGNSPVPKRIQTDHYAGWAITSEERKVYVLPERGNEVLSAICPHEGCEVMWEKDTNRFSCPCHESYFAADGSRVTGPARRGLDQLPSRVQDGKLQVLYQAFENNSAEQIKRA
jgi:Rieske Fe-S protein